MYHDFKVKLRYFAEQREWRIYLDGGQYFSFKSIDDIPQKLSDLLRMSAAAVNRMEGIHAQSQ